MNKIFTLVLSLFLISNFSFAQRIDYDHTSKWFLGLNVGATWQTTDVRNQTSAGYGFTLGRSFNYDYAKAISFDVRFRYLYGKWYGQDYDTTSLADYNPTNDITSNNFPLQEYKDSLGYSVNNFMADNHRVALELAMHFNRLTERTGFDPYIFGGIGLSFTETYGDLYNQDGTNNIYDYSSLPSINKTTLASLMDGIYETPLTGSNATSRNVQFMPSLGFGLAYQVGKRVTLGLEHKTTFTLGDEYDGFISDKRLKNDLYHYTSAFVQFRFKVRGDDYVKPIEPVACKDPVIYYRTPSSVTSTVGNQVYQLVADVYNVTAQSEIRLAINGVETTNFTYNINTHRLESTILLQVGTNNIDILASTTCGSVNSPVSIAYEPCNAPLVNLLNPSVARTAVTSPSYAVSFSVLNMTSSQGLTLTQNGQAITNFSFNNHTLTANVILNSGTNIFVLSATNNCGNASQTVEIEFQPCLAPVVNFLSPTTNGAIVTSSNFTLTAALQNVSAAGNIVIRHNGATVSGFTFSNGNISKNLTLVNGTNTFVISATNNCGTVNETITIDYQACTAPVLTVVNPSVASTTVSNQYYTLLASVQNTNVESVSISQNGQNIGVGSNQNGYVRKDVTLQSGLNKFVFTASNSCGTVTQTVNIIYNDCTPPTIGLITPASNGTTVSSASYTFSAQVNNVTATGTTVTLNGSTFATTYNNGLVRGTVNLQTGLNTFMVTATNACGTVTETVTINYSNCVAPTINMISPANSNNVTVTSNVYSFTAQVLNVSINQISVTQNGQAITGFTLTNGILKKDLSLSSGVNTIVIIATNSCGNASQSASITYNNCIAPTLSWLTPSNGNNVTVGSPDFTLGLQATNIANTQNVTIFQNGTSLTGISLNNGTISKAITLRPGENTITVAVANECGSVTETVTIIYNDCVPPTISWISPNNGEYITVTNSAYQLTAQVNHSTQQFTTITQNGQTITGWAFNNGLVTANVQLVAGVNLFVITTSNSCGNSSKTVKITYNDCIPPSFSWITPANGSSITVTNATYSLQAQIANAVTNQMSVTLNGQVLSDATIAQGLLKYLLKLQSGANVVAITITTPCGIITQTVTINYNDCVNPTINWISPANGTNITVYEEAYNVAVQIGNASIQNVSATQNGSPITNASFSNGTISAAVKLQTGVNTFVVTVSNDCGTVTETVTVTYVPCSLPTLSWLSPPNGQTFAAGAEAFTLSAQVQGVTLAGVMITQNGQLITGATLANNVLQIATTLVAGQNTFVVMLNNNCGRISESVLVTFRTSGSGNTNTGNGEVIDGNVGRPKTEQGVPNTTKPTTTKPGTTTTKPTTTKPGIPTTKPGVKPIPVDTNTDNGAVENADSIPQIKPR
ncbi:MAG: hypothetical protein V4638_00210 [Bacteroidota bacterium]